MAYLPNSDTCYVCGRVNGSGLKVRFRVESGEVKTTFVAGPDHCGYRDMVHGGVLSALLDETMGWAPSYHKRLFCYAAELRVRFVKHAPRGVPLTVTGRMTADRGRIWEAEGEITGPDGVIYARGWGKYVPMSAEGTREVLDVLHFDSETVPYEELAPEPRGE